ncbi:hypothetical protein FRC09_015852, partial [Ceratobasidium sp. 395]
MSVSQPVTESFHPGEPLEFPDWIDLWAFLDSGGAVFNTIKDIEDLIRSPRVSGIVQRTRFVKAYTYGPACSDNDDDDDDDEDVKFILVLIETSGQQQAGGRYLAVGPPIPTVNDIQPDVCVSTSRWLRVSDYGEDRTKFIEKHFGLGNSVTRETRLQNSSIDVPEFIERTCRPLHRIRKLSPFNQFPSWVGYFESCHSMFTVQCDQTNTIRPDANITNEAILKSDHAHTDTLRVTRDTKLPQLVDYFRKAGLRDYTEAGLEQAPGGRLAVHASQLADVYQITLSNGDEVAVKCVRFLPSEQDRQLKIHGDLKGDNILISDDGRLKLTDFGLTMIHQTALEFSKTAKGGGTQRWMAPELLAETSERSKEADIYALGMTLL